MLLTAEVYRPSRGKYGAQDNLGTRLWRHTRV